MIQKEMEERYPECTNELLNNFDKAYQLWCRKQADYGDGNIRLGLDISSNASSFHATNTVLAQLGVIIRMNDKVQRLLNIYKKGIFKGKVSVDVLDESVEDTCLDLMNYANMMMTLKSGKWGK